MSPTWQLTRTFDSEQGTISWDVLGSGPPVVLVHGTPFSSLVWQDVARALARRFEVYVWDLAGYGTSAKYDGQDVTLAAQGRILAALLDHWGLDRPQVVAHDFGGTVALRAHLFERRAYASLVLVDAVSLAPWGTGFFQLAKVHADVLLALPEPVHDGLVRGYVSWAMHRQPTTELVDALVAPWTGPDGRAALYRQIQQNDQRFTDDLEPRYGQIQVPTLVLWGEEDAWLPLEQGRALHRRIPGSQLRTFPQAGHLVQHDAPAELTAELVEFLMAPDHI